MEQQSKKPVVKKTTKKSVNPADSYPSRKGTIGGGEGKIPSGPSGNRIAPTYGGAKNGKTIKKAKSGASLKPVNASEKPGLAKLPTAVRNKMGYQKNGGKVKAKSGMKVAKCKSGCK